MTSHVLHASSPVIDIPLLVAVAVASVGAAVLLGLAIAAFLRRQSRPYLFVVLALGALLAQSVVAGLSIVGSLEANVHHLLEHGLDVALVALVIGAIYYARSVSREAEFD
ncbi:hypothetical protein [Haladaptatus sp. QDMS2]|uniref:DUF7471 family protein n=1 Tax=Haladaptatus sp. QDMS2 TaxID=3033391 RepID=UPI0023E7A838|nr:hypothetical protein [Haladaptatus sp. QDMS2]